LNREAAVSPERLFDLDSVPEGAVPHSVTAAPAIIGGRSCVRVELTDEITLRGEPFVDYIDQPTFLALPVRLRTGRIEVDVLSRLNHKTTFESRAFAGIAYRIDPELATFESVYLRPLNGQRENPPSPRDQRAVQYFAYPEWPFTRLRDEHDGVYEAGADIAGDEWIHLTVDLTEQAATVSVNGVTVLNVDHPKAPVRAGGIGLFVDIGSEGYFADLRVTPAD
jgi:hypothetical protein